MQPIALDSANYAGTYKLIGEEVGFDFINTISWRNTEREHDWLDNSNNFINWSIAAGIINKRQAKILKEQPNAVLAKQLEQVQNTRDDLFKILAPVAFSKKIDPDSIKKLDAMTYKILKHRHIDEATCQWIWADPITLSDVLAPVIWNAAYIITDLDHSRIKHCSACNWLFYDKTKNKSRKWCDMEDCGSRDKSLRYYHRQKK